MSPSAVVDERLSCFWSSVVQFSPFFPFFFYCLQKRVGTYPVMLGGGPASFASFFSYTSGVWAATEVYGNASFHTVLLLRICQS